MDAGLGRKTDILEAYVLRELILEIAKNYEAQSALPLKENSFAQRVRDNGKEILRAAVADENLLYKASVGAGNWAEIPWLGIFNPESTRSATEGIYVVYLFSSDFKKIYLCQGQGVTKIKEEFGKGQLQELKRRSQLIRARVPEHASEFSSVDVALGGGTLLAKEYDSAVAYHIAYDTDNLPKNETLESDLRSAVRLYTLLIARGGAESNDTVMLQGIDENIEDISVVERRTYVRHMKIERNSKAAALAKKTHGVRCQGCGIDFSWIYGDVGQGYIEAHHLRPLHTLEQGSSVRMDVAEDFAVLCSNCHSIVHRSKPMLTLDQLKRMPGVAFMRKAYQAKFGE